MKRNESKAPHKAGNAANTNASGPAGGTALPQDDGDTLGFPPAAVDHYRDVFASYEEGGKGVLPAGDIARVVLADCGLHLTVQQFTEQLVPLLSAPLVASTSGSGSGAQLGVTSKSAGPLKALTFKQFLEVARKASSLLMGEDPRGQPNNARRSTQRKASSLQSTTTSSPVTAPSMSGTHRDRRTETRARLLEKLQDLRESVAESMMASAAQGSSVVIASPAAGMQPLAAKDDDAASGVGAAAGAAPEPPLQQQPTEAKEEELVSDCIEQLSLMGIQDDAALGDAPLTAAWLVSYLDALCDRIGNELAAELELVEAYTAEDLHISAEVLQQRQIERAMGCQSPSRLQESHAQDEARLERDLMELELFAFPSGTEPLKKQGAIAFRARVRDFPYFMFPIDSVCSRLDALDELQAQYEKALHGKEFLLVPKCPDGRQCRMQDVPEHRLSFTHPCFSEEVPCPHRHRRLHMRCYAHEEDDNSDYEMKLKALQRRLGVIEITGMELGDAGAQCLAFVLQQDRLREPKPMYREVHMASNHISPDGGASLIEACQHLSFLDLSGNALGYKTVALVQGSAIGPSLHTLLTKADHLVSLNLSRNRLSDRDGRYIAEGLKTNTTLKHLDLRRNELGATFGEDMASALAENRDLRELLLGWNRLESSGSCALLAEMKTSSTLELIDLSWTGISDEAAKHVAEMISGSLTLRALSIAHNNVGPDGCAAISAALKANKTLQSLDVSFNPLGTKATSELVKELKDNVTLEVIDIRCVKAGEDVAEDIKRLIKAREPRMQQAGLKMTIMFSTSVVGGSGPSLQSRRR